MPNRLKDASSPYLQQHADNPVDWYEWGEEAFARAREEDKPVFLSVGYSSCHWCHVMAHESFEDAGIAAVLNERYVAVKVDREERPDVDAVYMDAVQALTGRGGWPMSVFLTPQGTPFFGGTYWPKDDRLGMPGFRKVLDAVWDAWTKQRDEVLDAGQRLTAHLQASHQVTADGDRPDVELARHAARGCVQAWDRQHGGFGPAPKFPQAMTVDFLLAHHVRTRDESALEAAVSSLERMARGGIRDQVGGGFHRYSVDETWLVPHFEKMLYDNALLLRAYTHAWQVTGRQLFARVAVDTADYLLREMRHPDGAFYSATDADSEGEEGRFFTWAAEEFDEVVAGAGEDPQLWRRCLGVTDEGNFVDPHVGGPRRNILSWSGQDEDDDEAFRERLQRVRQALYERREQRVHPGLDDKVLVSWNALALGALAEAGAVLQRRDYVEAARRCAAFLRSELVVGGQLQHTWREGHGAKVPAFLEDVANLAQALLVLYEADGDPDWFAWARRLATEAEVRFADGDTGTYFSSAHDAESLLTRPKDLWDNATPAGSSVMVDVHLRLAAFTNDLRHRDDAERTLAAFQTRAAQAPTGYGELLHGLERLAAGSTEVAIVGDPGWEATAALVQVYRRRLRPGAVLAVGLPGTTSATTGREQRDFGGVRDEGADEAFATPPTQTVPLLIDRPLVDGTATAYVCREFACERPVTTPQELEALLDGTVGGEGAGPGA